jgi:hypothetical protein
MTDEVAVEQFSKIPNELICHIFRFCDAVAARFVCRHWYQLLGNRCVDLGIRLYDYASNGEIAKLAWCLEDLPCKGQYVCEGAIRGNQLSVLTWALENNVAFDNVLYHIMSSLGHLNMLKHCKNRIINYDNCWSGAANNGQMHILEWLATTSAMPDDILSYGVSSGRIDVLQWLHEHGAQTNSSLWILAALWGNVPVLNWLENHNVPRRPNLIQSAAERGRLEAIKWFTDHGEMLTTDACVAAARCGELETLMWMLENGAPLSANICRETVANDHCPILEKLYANYSDLIPDIYNPIMIYEAANHNNLPLCKWLWRQGCSWDGFTVFRFLERKNTKALYWLDKHLRKTRGQRLMEVMGYGMLDLCVRYDDVTLIQYLLSLVEFGINLDNVTDEHFLTAISERSIAIINYLLVVRSDFRQNAIIRQAALNCESPEIIKLLSS